MKNGVKAEQKGAPRCPCRPGPGLRRRQAAATRLPPTSAATVTSWRPRSPAPPRRAPHPHLPRVGPAWPRAPCGAVERRKGCAEVSAERRQRPSGENARRGPSRQRLPLLGTGSATPAGDDGRYRLLRRGAGAQCHAALPRLPSPRSPPAAPRPSPRGTVALGGDGLPSGNRKKEPAPPMPAERGGNRVCPPQPARAAPPGTQPAPWATARQTSLRGGAAPRTQRTRGLMRPHAGCHPGAHRRKRGGSGATAPGPGSCCCRSSRGRGGASGSRCARLCGDLLRCRGEDVPFRLKRAAARKVSAYRSGFLSLCSSPVEAGGGMQTTGSLAMTGRPLRSVRIRNLLPYVHNAVTGL